MTQQKATLTQSDHLEQAHKLQLRRYFDGVGFERWAAIYGQGELSSVRRSIREGHTSMLAQAAAWLDEQTFPADARALDAGCGTGLFSTALARRGFAVTAIDIAPQMVNAAVAQSEQTGVRERINFVTGDLETIRGSYDVVACFDVLIHYPQAGFAPMCRRLAQSCRGTLLLTYAPHNQLLAMMHWLGGHFPKSQRRTEIQMMRDSFVAQTLASAGMRVCRSVRVSKGFYHVTLLEARREESL
jgi:magnesium-protoporphyrin O-methyltransferase